MPTICHPSVPCSTQPIPLEMRLVCLAAQMVLENGGETYRVEETALRMAKGFALEDTNIVAFPTSIFVTVGSISQVRRITHRGTNTKRLAQINDVSRKVEHGEMNAQEALRTLESIACDPGWHPLTMMLACGVAAAGFSLMFGGTPGVLLVTLLIGILNMAIQPLFAHMAMGALFANFSGGLLTAFLARAIHLLVPYGDVNAAIIGGIMPLLSGLLMTTAVRDTVYGDLVSGLTRAVEALLLAGSVALGVYIGLRLALAMGGVLL
ncbi:MAG: threonine/serine exporter family protein [Clostridia bacterium]|nr:threonine/serine exporter family protein [Clostridia bacterium]